MNFSHVCREYALTSSTHRPLYTTLLPEPTSTGRTTHPVRILPLSLSVELPRLITPPNLDYEQQRLHLLHKHGIDLEDSNGLGDGTRTKRLDRKEVERLMGGGDGQSGVFTWREKHRRKVRCSPSPGLSVPAHCHGACGPACVLCVSGSCAC